MFNTSLLTAAVASLILSLSATAHADNSNPKFFDKNFALGFETQDGESVRKPEPGNEAKPSVPVSSALEKGKKQTSESRQNQSVDLFAREGGGEKIVSVSVLFDGMNKASLSQNLKEYFAITEKTKTSEGDLILIGEPEPTLKNVSAISKEISAESRAAPTAAEKNIINRILKNSAEGDDPEDPQDVQGLADILANSQSALVSVSLFTKVKVRDNVPKEFTIRRFPAWIIETESGTYALDGVLTPRKAINSAGRFFPDKMGEMQDPQGELKSF